MVKTVLVTGASSGIGQATAIYLAQKGYTVYGAARRLAKLQALDGYGIHPIEMDVTNEESITNGMTRILRQAGCIDILVNAAGLGSYGALEDVPMAEARQQMEINLVGPARLMQLVLPSMRKNSYGKIVNISSVGGKIGLPMGSWYHASKFALEGLSDALRNELRPFGIDVAVIEPGGTKSDMMAIGGQDLMRVSGHTAYQKLAAALKKQYETMEKSSVEPVEIAKLIHQAIDQKKPKARYVGGAMAKPMLFLRWLLPDQLFDKLLMSQLS